MSYVKVEAVSPKANAKLKRKAGKAKVKDNSLVKTDVLAPVVDRRGLDKDTLTLMGIKAVADYLGVSPVEGEDYDLLYGDVKISVHTQSTNLNEISGPLNGWIKDPDVDQNQDCHVYVFTRVNSKTVHVFIAGWITRDAFYDLAIHYVAGDKVGCVTAHDAGYSILYEALSPIETLSETLTMTPRRRNASIRAAAEKRRRGQ